MKKILVIRLDRIGDVILSTPVFKALREAYPQGYIAAMVRPYANDVVDGNPYIDEVILYDKDKKCKSALATLGFILRLRKNNFDIAVILHPSNRSHAIAYLAGIPQRVGYNRKLGFLLTRAVPHTKQLGLRHEVDYNLGLLRYIGIEPSSRELCMPIKGASEVRIEALFKSAGINDYVRAVVIHPWASCPSKRWSQDGFAWVADRLIERYGVKIIIIAGKDDKEFGDRVSRMISAKHLNLSGEASISDLASIFKRSRLLISNDSGPVHIACAVGAPVVVIFGRADSGLSSARWGPIGGDDVILQKYIGCEKCLAHDCDRDFECLAATTKEEVLEAASKLLTRSEKLC